ncbi:hypothetical protein JM18_002511 [Phytophthora kernoviae]|uniref:PX domain-containing protein n=2 Tax=Phytophthora kernoviae TaxID=325452 RepID=A0A8T0LSV5_9STRA|nr:hypothetical protein G195_008258 [Phytophthora kernoviae 00238/432]KAG2520668.1 hypothetical protein JM16_005661 [Phytophthora kernoviae]KAG2530079.1 hypothetical protein JM18_002511 [Phytophthora kernoviae]
MVNGQLRVAVIGSQTRHKDTPKKTYTVYRTAVNYRGLCYHRLIRYRHFMAFAKKVKLAPDEKPIRAKLPPKIWWSRKASLKEETVEARQVLLNEFMQQVCARRLTSKSEERLLKLLKIGDYADKEDQEAAERRLSKQQSSVLTECASDVLERNSIMQISTVEEAVQEEDETVGKKARCSSTDDESPRVNAEQLKPKSPQPEDPEPATGMGETRESRALSVPLPSPLQLRARPLSMSFSQKTLKNSLLESNRDSDGGRGSTGSDYPSTSERHFFGQIKGCLSSIDRILDSSRNIEGRVREKQEANTSKAA